MTFYVSPLLLQITLKYNILSLYEYLLNFLSWVVRICQILNLHVLSLMTPPPLVILLLG